MRLRTWGLLGMAMATMAAGARKTAGYEPFSIAPPVVSPPTQMVLGSGAPTPRRHNHYLHDSISHLLRLKAVLTHRLSHRLTDRYRRHTLHELALVDFALQNKRSKGRHARPLRFTSIPISQTDHFDASLGFLQPVPGSVDPITKTPLNQVATVIFWTESLIDGSGSNFSQSGPNDAGIDATATEGQTIPGIVDLYSSGNDNWKKDRYGHKTRYGTISVAPNTGTSAEIRKARLTFAIRDPGIESDVMIHYVLLDADGNLLDSTTKVVQIIPGLNNYPTVSGRK